MEGEYPSQSEGEPRSNQVFCSDTTGVSPWCVNFARIYSLDSFKERVLKHINKNKFNFAIYQIKIDGKLMPIMTAPGNRLTSKINYPYWALYIAFKQRKKPAGA